MLANSYMFSSALQSEPLDVPSNLDIIFEHLVAHTVIDSCDQKYLT